jgi:hypothetical protein
MTPQLEAAIALPDKAIINLTEFNQAYRLTK